MDVKKLIELLTDGSNEEIYEKLKSIVEGGKADLIVDTFKKYEDALADYSDNERAEEDAVNGDMSLGLDLYKGITKLILGLGKALAINNFETLEEAYDIQEFAQGYIDDYKFFVESYLEDDEKELEEMNSIYEEIKTVFDDADYED